LHASFKGSKIGQIEEEFVFNGLMKFGRLTFIGYFYNKSRWLSVGNKERMEFYSQYYNFYLSIVYLVIQMIFDLKAYFDI
jgi:hypothetical protein